MFEKMNIDVGPKSQWKTATPTSYTMSLPFYLLEWGHFIANRIITPDVKIPTVFFFFTP